MSGRWTSEERELAMNYVVAGRAALAAVGRSDWLPLCRHVDRLSRRIEIAGLSRDDVERIYWDAVG